MGNKRIFYAVEAVGFATVGTNTFTPVKGLQSIGISTKFNLEQVFELGQLSLYQNIESIPDIEVTLEKFLDGNTLLYHQATKGSLSADLFGRANVRTTLGMSLYSDQQASASGTPVSQVTCSGLFVSSITYQARVDGNASESLSLVGNNKTWLNAGFTFTPTYTNADGPLAAEGVNRRQHVKMGESAGCSLFPKEIPGITASGTNPTDATNIGNYTVPFQSYRVTANLGRDALLELGQKGAYWRFVSWPVEVRTDLETIAINGDQVNALENGALSNGNNLADQVIYLAMTEGTKLDLGSKNRLTSVNFGGANAGGRGGNATLTYSYVNYNDCKVVHPQDATVALQG